MTSLDRFRERNVALKKLNSKFIFNGYPSTTITREDVSVQAAVVNQQEKDKAYVYTPLEDKLAIGNVWMAKTLPLLITEEIVIIKDVQWNKYVALIANLQVENSWGYFKGPEKSYVNIALEKDAAIDSRQKPVLVLPEKILGFEDKIVIKNRAWLVQEYDAISDPGLVYYSLTPSTVSKEIAAENEGKEVYIEHKKETEINFIETPITTFDDENILIANNINITISTEGGYFRSSNRNIKINKHTGTEVVFNLPFGVKETTIEFKEKGQVISKTYKVQ